jgi:hypothetical protein
VSFIHAYKEGENVATIARKEVDFDKCFPEDVDQYYDIATSYLNITTEDFVTAFDISKKAWVLADRWNSIKANASKLATMHGCSKTDLKEYCHGKHRQMQYIHEHCRILWRSGEESVKRTPAS